MEGWRRRKRSGRGLGPRPGQVLQTSLGDSPSQKVYCGDIEKPGAPRYSHLCHCSFVQQMFVKLPLCAGRWAGPRGLR